MIYDAIIVGAGMSGITAGNKLIEKGFNVKLLDKGKMLGGRLATRRISYNGKKTVFDYGCKYLEASSFEFSTKIVDLIRGNNLKKWNVINQNSLLNELDKSLKFISKKSIRDVAIELAKDLNVESNTKVEIIKNESYYWSVYTDDKKEFRSKNLLLSMPIPQSLDLMKKSNIKFDETKLRSLNKVKYNKSIVGIFTIKNKSNLFQEGGLKIENGDIAFITDNNLKGINSNQTAIVVEMTNEFSVKNWDNSESEVITKIKELSQDWIGTEFLFAQIHKWKYSTPSTIYNKRFEVFDDPLPLYIIGDAFMGNNVESAYLSGLFSAKNIVGKNTDMMESKVI